VPAFLEANASYAARFKKAGLQMPPARKLAVVGPARNFVWAPSACRSVGSWPETVA
jgi:hypothetical protein